LNYNFQLILLLLLSLASKAHSDYLEHQYADTHFTVKAKASDFERADIPDTSHDLYIAQIEVLQVYYGEIAVGEKLELHIEYAVDDTRSWKYDDLLQGEFVTTFCLSDSGIYFTPDLYSHSNKTVAALNRFRIEGTSLWERHDCHSTRKYLNDPDALDYIDPVPRHGGNHSNLHWRNDEQFQIAYHDAIAQTLNPDWVNKFQGTGRSRDSYTFANTDWLQISLCDPENCGRHSMTILYSDEKNKAIALISDRVTYFAGEPSDSARSLLLTIHSDIFSSRNDSVEKRLYDPDNYARMQAWYKQESDRMAPVIKLYETLVNIDIKD